MSDDPRLFRRYLLAAGRGRRSGGPKAWREADGISLLERHVRFARETPGEGDLVVAIQESWRARCVALDPGVRWVAVDPDAPPMASLLELVRSVPLDRWSFIYHVDMPLWEVELFRVLADHAQTSGGFDAIIPTHQRRGGHPVVLAAGVAGALLTLDPATDRMDHWLRTRTVDRLEVPFPCVVENWNYPSRNDRSRFRDTSTR